MLASSMTAEDEEAVEQQMAALEAEALRAQLPAMPDVPVQVKLPDVPTSLQVVEAGGLALTASSIATSL